MRLLVRLALAASLLSGCATLKPRAYAEDMGGGSGGGLWAPPPGLYLSQAGVSGGNNWSVTGNLAVTGTSAFTGLATFSNGITVSGTAILNSGVRLGSSISDTGGAARITAIAGGTTNFYVGTVADSGTNVAHQFKNSVTLTGSTRIAEFHNDNGAASAESWVANDGTFAAPAFVATATGLFVRGAVVDGGSAVGVQFGNVNSLTTAGAKIASFHSNNFSAEKFYVDKDGSTSSAFTTLRTCAAGIEGMVSLDVLSGVSTGKRTKLCLCTSNGSATYVWQNLATATLGSTTACGSE